MTNLQQQIATLRGDPAQRPDAAVVIPVNAQTDLENALRIVREVASYAGRYTIEIVLMVNNYAPDQLPAGFAALEQLGLTLICRPSIRRPGEPPGFTARMYGLRASAAEHAILFDADCHIPNPTALLDWYIARLHSGVHVAYTHVDYYGLARGLSVWARVQSHHLSRWVKRALLGVPTTRGSNYAVNRSFVLNLYDQGYLADEMNVGPTIKAKGGIVAYAGARHLRVLTSGRYLHGGWGRLARYLAYRLRYNIRVLPVRSDVAERTGRR